MKPPSFLKRHLILTSSLVVGFGVMAFVASVLVIRLNHGVLPNSSAFYLAKLIENIDPKDPVRALSLLEGTGRRSLPRRLWLFDEHGNVLYPSGKRFSGEWSRLPLPTAPYGFERIQEWHFLPSRNGVVRLGGATPRYLLIESDHQGSHFWYVFSVSFAFLLVAMISGGALSLLVLYRTLKRQAELADGVLSEMQRGNLKARFPVEKRDEFGQAMLRFNRMADEIERLVERLKRVERERRDLIEELAHDLRTPLASLGSLLETVVQRKDALEPEVRDEFLDLSLQEVRYFTRLVEDFVFLAHVGEPRYQRTTDQVILATLLKGEIEKVAAVYNGRKEGSLQFESPAEESAGVLGDYRGAQQIVVCFGMISELS